MERRSRSAVRQLREEEEEEEEVFVETYSENIKYIVARVQSSLEFFLANQIKRHAQQLDYSVCVKSALFFVCV